MVTTIERPKPGRKLREITPARRRRIEKAVEKLIDVLDTADAPSEDLEDTADDEPPVDEEPSLGSVDNATNQDKWAPPGYGIDLEGDEHDGREPDVDDEAGGDDEPSLGAPEPLEPDPQQGHYWGGKLYAPDDDDRAAVYDQVSWFGYDDSDREAEQDGREPEPAEDDEQDRWDNTATLNVR